MTLLAAFDILLMRHGRQDDVIVGTPVAGRERKELRGLIGCFINTLVLRTDLSGDPSFEQLLARVRKVVLGATSHQQVPFEKLLEVLIPQRGGERAPLFQVLFNMLSFPAAKIELPGLVVEPLEVPEVGAKFDLTVYVEEAPGGLRFRWLYDPEVLDGARVEVLSEQYRGLLEQIVEGPSESISRLTLRSERFVGRLPDPCQSQSVEWCGAVHERVAEVAQRHPDRVAGVDRRGAMS
jgi:non-ribosomal peptide synthetase component F